MKLLHFIIVLLQYQMLLGTEIVVCDDCENTLSQGDINLVFQNDLEQLHKRLNYLEKNNKNGYDKLMKFAQEHQIKIEALDRYSIAHNCGNSMSKGQFARAAEMLKYVHIKNYDEVIHSAYGNNSENFEKIIIFANLIGKNNTTKALHLLEELFNQTKDSAKSYELMKIITETQKHEKSPDGRNLKTKVLDVFASKLSETITKTISPLSVVFTNHTFSVINNVNKLDKEAGAKLVSDIIKRLAESGKINSLIRYISSINHVTLKIQSYSNLFDIIQENLATYSPNLFYLIRCIQRTLVEPGIEENEKNQLLSLVKKFPSCMEQAAYSESVCIQNKYSENYLKVSKFGRDNKWWLHLSPFETAYNRTKWTFRPYYSNLFIIKNNYLGYMSLDNNDFNFTNQSFDSFKKKIYNESLWTVFVKLGDCYLKTINRYLKDTEGEPEISSEVSESSKWIFKQC